nr:protein DMR6-LIKE OXYGENASE 2-like isoform X1 [Ipomoea trifida]
MATPKILPHEHSPVAPTFHSSRSVKVLSESPNLNSIPSNYVHSSSHEESPDFSDAEDSSLIPVIDFSQLTSDHSDHRSKAIQVLGKACEEWGFFMVVNHGIPESLIKAVIDVTNEFFNMPKEDKKQFEDKHVLDPIRSGTAFNPSKEKALFWRDFLKVFVHPEFHCPSDPQALSDLILEYSENCRRVVKKLLGAISESLGLDECVMNEAMGLDSMFQLFNIFSNGKYKSVSHRAMVNNEMTRISVAVGHGPALETIVRPASPLVQRTDAEDSTLIPIIDFFLLTSDHSDHRSKAIQALGKACEEWGFFMVVNHGIPESLIKAVIDVTDEFFNMGEEDKKQFEGKDVLDTIRCGTSFNSSKEKAFFWRDFLKVFVHPQFHCPSHPQAFSEVMSEYCEKSRKVAKKILGAISESLGLDECAINNALALDSMFQIFIGNYYPRCPQPELVMGLPPHSDHGLLTLLIQNGVGGLQIMHEQKWIDVNALPNSLLVNTADALEIFSNGKYKSVMHRAVVNNKEKRISIAMAHGPSPETVVRPTSQLVERAPPAAYRPIKYNKDYIHLQPSNQLDGKSCLDHVRIQMS